MLDLQKLEKLLNINLGTEILKYHETENVSSDTTKENNTIQSTERPPVWSAEKLPATTYTINEHPKNLEKIEQIALKKINTIKPKKLAAKLYALDLYLIKNITAEDLVKYDGKITPISIAHLQNKNHGLLAWITSEFSFNYIKKMMRESHKLKNFNFLNILVKSAQGRNLTGKDTEKVLYYKEVLDLQEGGVFPFEWLLKDCADSNVNVNSEIASMRFCRILDKFKDMKLLETPMKLSENTKQFILGNIWKYLENDTEMANTEQNTAMKLYLVI